MAACGMVDGRVFYLILLGGCGECEQRGECVSDVNNGLRGCLGACMRVGDYIRNTCSFLVILPLHTRFNGQAVRVFKGPGNGGTAALAQQDESRQEGERANGGVTRRRCGLSSRMKPPK